MNYQDKLLFEVAEQTRPYGKPIMTGISAFDSAMDGGLRDGELITISGASGHGKTTYAINIAKIIADSGVPVHFFTFEMQPWYLKEKFVSLGSDENLKVYTPVEHSDNKMDWFKGHILNAQDKFLTKVIFIDHLHYLIPRDTASNTSIIVGDIVRKIKRLAVETDSIIFLIAHMKRLSYGERTNIDGIRDSALIANESDYVYLVERLKRKIKKGALDSVGFQDILQSDFSNYAKVQLAKNRRTGTLKNLYFEVSNQSFNELLPEQASKLQATIEL